jgi:hypothetical protein
VLSFSKEAQVFMKRGFATSVLTTIFAIGCVTGVASARSFFWHSSSTKSFNLIVDEPTSVAPGTELQPGTYRVQIPLNTQNPTVQFTRDGKVVATVQAKAQSESTKNPHTEFVSEKRAGGPVMTEIDPGGMNVKFILNRAGENKSKS